ncbi:MAG TPA: hypothetical protein VK809_11170 [Bacteroidia bacterium]|nr:hypothetical protein [Bacteroidia bacterium]
MNTTPIVNTSRKIILLAILFSLILITTNSIAQNMLPYRNDVLNHKISAVIITNSVMQEEKSKKGTTEKSKIKYVDTVRFDMYGTLTEKRITAYDTDSKREYAGVWTYTYDSLGNRRLETRVEPEHHSMDYYNYVYDSNRIYKQIWVYWVNMKHIFDRIYQVKYDGYGRLKTEIIEEGNEKIDTVISFQFDTLNHLHNILTTSDKVLKDTINLVTYFYNSDGSTDKTITSDKTGKNTEEFTYDPASRKLLKKSSDKETTTYIYDKNGLMTESDIVPKNKKGVKYKYTLSYIYK